MHYKLSILSVFAFAALTASAQVSRLGEDIEYKGELSGQFGSGDFTPFWQSSNRYGLSSVENNSGYLRAAIRRDTDADSTRSWRIGYGADLVAPLGYDSHFIVQQLYGDVRFRDALQLSVGQKERPLEMKNDLLSTGGLTTGISARPLPQVRLEFGPDYYTFRRTKGWIAMKCYLAYGWYTDNGWQRDFNAGNTKYIYTANSLYHTKAAFLRVGNTEKFPLQLGFGFEMSSQFGGEAWNVRDRVDHNTGTPLDPHQTMNSGLKGYWNAFIPGGNDANDGDYSNVEGNQLGSYQLRLDYKGKGWSLGLYGEHYFDDHSQMFFQYAWKDMLIGVEAQLPKNPVVSGIVYEHLRTTDQSGPVYHDATANLPISIAGIDNYYNHHVYGAWQHAGFGMGSPLIISPAYNRNGRIPGGDGRLYCYDNRITANHIGISGQPTDELGYRLLFTHERSLGNYDAPRQDPVVGRFFLVEASYSPHQVPGLALTASYGQNSGELLGNSKGGMLTVSYSGWINKKK